MSSSGAWPVATSASGAWREPAERATRTNWWNRLAAAYERVLPDGVKALLGTSCAVAAGVAIAWFLVFEPLEFDFGHRDAAVLPSVSPPRLDVDRRLLPPRMDEKPIETHQPSPRRRRGWDRREPERQDFEGREFVRRGSAAHFSWATANGQAMQRMAWEELPPFDDGATFQSLHSPVDEVWYQEDATGQRYLWIEASDSREVVYRTHGFDRRKGERYPATTTASRDAWTGSELLIDPPSVGWEAVAYP